MKSFKEVREKYLESVGAADNDDFDEFLFNKYFMFSCNRIIFF